MVNPIPAAVAAPVRVAMRRVLDAVLPPQCLACGAIVDTPHRLCGTCFRGIDHIAAPQCAVCGLPFEIDMESDALCAGCAADRPPFNRARAAMRYGGVARDMILALKHGDRTHTAPGLGRLMAAAGGDLLATSDVCVPVPLHRWRLARRRFNQAALLARALRQHADFLLLPGALRRIRQTPSQGGLSRAGRHRNVRGAFRLDPRANDRIDSRTILLIDDVYTTGATVAECARVLRRAGAGAVNVLTVARVVQNGPAGETTAPDFTAI